MTNQCGCGGSNENCTFCFGSGYRPDTGDAPDGSKSSSVSTLSSGFKKKGSEEPLITGSSSKAARSASRATHSTSGNRTSSACTRQQVNCPGCGVPVREDLVSCHLRLRCPRRADPNLRNYQPPLQQPPRSKATSHSTAKKSSRAVSRKRPKQPPKAPPASMKISRSTLPVESTPELDQLEEVDATLTEIDNHREERRLDGSRDYWRLREDGRFGSHPSFDDCDDESTP